MNNLISKIKRNNEKVANIAGIILSVVTLVFVMMEVYPYVQRVVTHEDVVAVSDSMSTGEVAMAYTEPVDVVNSVDNVKYDLIEKSLTIVAYDKVSGMYKATNAMDDVLYFYDNEVKDHESVSVGDKVVAMYLDDKEEESLFLFVVKDNVVNKLISRMEEN